jgi:endonuclease YncB( thermonuclease family)
MGRKPGRKKSTFVLIVAIVLILLGYFARESARQQAPPAGGSLAAGTYVVARVYDGDSLMLENGAKVRLAGIDAPDAKYYMHYADQSRTRAKKLLEGATVRLVPAEEPLDRYKRTLSYLYLDEDGVEVFVNAELARLGLACAFPYEPNTMHADEIIAAQREAQRTRRGLWNRSPKKAPHYTVETGPKFSLTHRPDCRKLAKSQHEKKRFDKRLEALNHNRGAPPCRHCQP